MTTQEFISTIKQQLPDRLLLYVNDMNAEIVQRVKDKQEKANGGAFGTYTKNYAKRRQNKGLSNTLKNFYFSGTMWSGFGVVDKGETPTSTFVEIGGKTQDSSDRLAWNSDREDTQIDEPSEKELNEVGDKILNWIRTL